MGFRGLALADVGRDADQPHCLTMLVANDEAPVMQVSPSGPGHDAPGTRDRDG